MHSNVNNSKFNTIASMSSSNKSKQNTHAGADYDANSNSQLDILNESFTNSINSSNNAAVVSGNAGTCVGTSRKGAALYIICDKSQAKVN
jgi:hypothetical protein